MIDPTSIRVITFDAGGTLLFPHPNVGAIYAEILAAHQVHLCPDQLEKAFLQNWKELIAQPKEDVSHAAEKQWWLRVVSNTLQVFGHPPPAEEVFEDLWEAFAQPRRWRLREGTETVLPELTRRGYRLAILSNWDQRLRILLERMNLANLFDNLFISSEIGFEKPAAEIFQAVEKSYQLPPAAFLHIGDSRRHDAEAAQAVGWQSVLLANQCSQFQNSEGLNDLPKLLNYLPPREVSAVAPPSTLPT